MSPPPFRADQVGSLLRPDTLIEARKNLHLGQGRLRAGPQGESEQHAESDVAKEDVSSANGLQLVKTEQNRAIKEVVQEQLNRKILPIVTGEYERTIFYDKFFEALTGFELRYTPLEEFKLDFPTNRPLLKWGVPGRDAGYPTGKKVSLDKSAYLDDWLFLKSLLPESQWKNAKMTIPPPGWWHIQLKNPYSKELYATDEELLADLSAAVRKEILTLYDHGLRVIQVDDPNLSFFCDEAWIQTCKSEGVDLERLLELYVKSHNDAVKDLPSDLHIGLHVCRGNFPNGVGLASGSYERIARKLFDETSYKVYYLEFDGPRAGDFTPLKHLPVDKAVVLGVVTTKFSDMENLDDLKAKVCQAADAIAEGQGRTREDALRDNLAVSTQCGFASDHSEGGVGMTRDRMWEKLQLVQALSEAIWPRWNE